MTASVENRQYGRLEPGLNGVVHSFKTSTNRRSDSPGRGCNFPTNPEFSRPKAPVAMDGSSSDDEGDWKESLHSVNHEVEPSILDPRDEGTADNWIVRNPSMIRLTGKHPFNSEAPLTRLMHHGFITPVPLHYVRNHGSVPKASWSDWTVEICGLVKRPGVFTMEQLVNEFPSREFPATLVCAGNRRKEQNLIKKTIGFNWGSAGVSTSVWRGVRLRDVLKRCGIYSRGKGALNVCFEGAEDLPGGGGSKYGTSVRKEVAMDPSRDIILAYMQNGEMLTPDHGFPVRMIIPGFIGGRMVKWLKRIIVTTEESHSYYHYRDNRVLPSHVDAELANAEAWWYKPESIINELNINSVITTPCHEEILPINSATTQGTYTLRGYAYSGGGKKVTRVEVTLDGGETWLPCAVDHQEKPNKYGRYWCWCFWSLEVEVLDLLGAKEIAVRAWDETLNTQPEKLIWNVMGMMNNCWFRVKTNVCRPHKGEIGIVFEHPTQPGNQTGGWMARQKHLDKSEADSTMKKSTSTPFMNTSSKMYSMAEVKKHNSAESAWIVVHGHVYDSTGFLKDHPGGTDSILINAGTDCTEEFDAIHSDKAKKLLEDFRIGELITTGYASSDSTSSSPNNSVHGATNFTHLAPIKEAVAVTRSVALIPREKIKCKLVSKTSISHDVRVFRFALPSEDQILGLPVGKHIFLCARIDDKLCMRAYTPTTTGDEVGYFELVIKVYFKGVHPKFPNGGLMSEYLDSLSIGATLDVKGPLGHIEYTGRGNFIVHGKHKFAKKLAMIAGGTGITPIYQIIQAILKDPEDETEMYVVYANRTEEDILLREELDSWAEKHERMKVWYVVGTCREGWNYSVGHITESVLREHVPEGSDDTLALACRTRIENSKKKEMKLVWSPEIASKAYIDTVKSCEIFQESSIAELVSAMAGGWNARLIVEAWFRGGATATSVGLAVASQHARGRHVCVVPDEVSRSEYLAAMHKAGMSPEVMVGEAEEVMRGLVGVDFLVVDCRRKDRAQVLRFAKLGHRGAVLICKNAAPRGALGFRWRSVLDKGSRIVRTAFLPVGKGLEIAYIGASRDESLSSVKGSTSSRSRWVRHIDQESGEENVFRR